MDFYTYNNMGGSNRYGSQNENNNGNNCGNYNNSGGYSNNGSSYNANNRSGGDKANENGGSNNFQNKFDEYSSMSEKQLYAELANVVDRMKREGTFDISALENLYATSKPYLNDMQRARMKGIIDMLKSQ